jgi:hypothetical protein
VGVSIEAGELRTLHDDLQTMGNDGRGCQPCERKSKKLGRSPPASNSIVPGTLLLPTMLAEGMNVVEDLMGHEDIKTTTKYLHLDTSWAAAESIAGITPSRCTF